MLSPTARLFDLNNRNFSFDPEYNVVFLNSIQQFLNDKLKVRGHVFLNDVYDALDFERTQAGARLGWFYDGPDVYIHFGAMTPDENGAVLLTFNTQGEIATKLPEF